VEAVEAWYEAVLRVSWVELAERYGLDVSFVKVSCDYLRPLIAGQVVNLQVWVTRSESSSHSFTVSGEIDDGGPCFIARLTGCFVERNKVVSTPIPAELRQRIENYQDQCDEATVIPNTGDGLALSSRRIPDGAGLVAPGRHCLSGGKTPYTRQRRVVYGDCDVSGNIYAPRVFDYAVEVVGDWFDEILGVSWMDLVCKHGQGAPFVSVACEYLQPMVPGQMVCVTVRVTRLGGASIGFAVVGYDADGAPCFDAHLVACFITQNGFKAMRIPKAFRKVIEAYQVACEVLDRDKKDQA
jgi:4-hydroxybenzoyl-CoA thioesterase